MYDDSNDGGLRWYQEIGCCSTGMHRTGQSERTRQGTDMPKINDMLPSNYLKQADVDQDYIVTIGNLEQRNIAKDDDQPELKWLLYFEEFEKPMVLNSTNIQLLAKACGSDDTDDWIGKQVIVYTDPNISFGGKVVGGLRIKKHQVSKPVAPRSAAKGKPLTAGDPREDQENDIPF